MDIQLQELVDKIKKDGVDAASAEASKIVQEAEGKASAIIANAQKEADALIQGGKNEAAREKKAAEDAIKQVARNLLISFRDGIADELSAIIKAETDKALDASVLKAVLPDVIKAWAAEKGDVGLEVLLPANKLADVQASLLSALKGKVAGGVEISAGEGFEGGFRIAEKDGSAYYDFSAEAVADLFSSYLTPKVAEIMKAASKEL